MKSFVRYAAALAVAVLPLTNAQASTSNKDEYCTTKLTAMQWTSAVPTYTLTTITRWTTTTLTSTDLSYTTFTPATVTVTSTSTSINPSTKIVYGPAATAYTTKYIPYTTTSTYTPPVSTSWSTIDETVTETPDPVTHTSTKFIDTVAYYTKTNTVTVSKINTAPTNTIVSTVTPDVSNLRCPPLAHTNWFRSFQARSLRLNLSQRLLPPSPRRPLPQLQYSGPLQP